MVCKTYPLGELKEYKYVVILSEYDGRILLSRHKERTTWETQGGHIEAAETPFEAAKRELYEESGAIQYEIAPFCDYWAGNEETKEGASGVVFTAKITKLGAIPESEMQEVKTFEELPEKLTYPAISTALFEKLREYRHAGRMAEYGIMGCLWRGWQRDRRYSGKRRRNTGGMFPRSSQSICRT